MIEVIKGVPPHQVRLCVLDTTNGIVGCLTGGESPHVGGVVLAVPRPSLTGEGASCDCWLIPVPGHKDLDVAVPIAKAICKTIGAPVSLTAGIHMDNAEDSDIQAFSNNCADAGEEILKLMELS